MREIKKRCGGGGHHLREAHAAPPGDPAQATSRWKSFPHKDFVRGELLSEQYHLCCYSELRPDEESLEFHIEHVENKSQNPSRTFDYANLAASALSSDDAGRFAAADLFGGHAPGKQSGCDMVQFVSCHQSNCRAFFVYLSDGRIEPSRRLSQADQLRAQYTIKVLNLDCYYLRNLRRQWWDELDQLFQEHVAKGWSIADLAAIDLVPTNGRLSRFFSLTRQYFSDVGENVLKNQAPNLY